MAAKATKLHSTPTGAFEEIFERGAERVDIARHAKVWPGEVSVRPRRAPRFVEIQPEVRSGLSTVRIPGQERDRGDACPVGETDNPIMNMTLRLRTPGQLPVPSYLAKLPDRGTRSAAAHTSDDCGTYGVISRYGPSQGRPVLRCEFLARHDGIVVSLISHDHSLAPPPRSSSSAAPADQIGHHESMEGSSVRLVTVVLTVSDLDRSAALYSDAFGLDFHMADHHGDDPWISGRHAATTWDNGAFLHFALYESKDGKATSGAQIAFRVQDLDVAHRRALDADAELIHEPKPQPWGRSARYRDLDGNIIELTEPG